MDNILGTFRELGPPDLCHIIKTNAKPGVREVQRLKSKMCERETGTGNNVSLLAWKLPLRVWRGCFVVSNPRRVPEFAHLLDGKKNESLPLYTSRGLLVTRTFIRTTHSLGFRNRTRGEYDQASIGNESRKGKEMRRETDG